MMKFLPNGTSAKMTLGLKPSRVKTTRGRLGDGAKEHTFDIGFGELEAAWRDNRIEAAFKSGIGYISEEHHPHTPLQISPICKRCRGMDRILFRHLRFKKFQQCPWNLYT
jgi:hypothetical protein